MAKGIYSAFSVICRLRRRLQTIKKPFEIATAVSESGVRKTQLSFNKILVLAILAGAYIGFGAHLATTVTMDLIPLVGIGLTNLIAGAVFSVGLMLVVLGGAELFTGNNLIILSYLDNKSNISCVLTNWFTTYIGNFIGSILLASIIFAGGFYSMGGYALGVRALLIANGKVNLPFIQLVARGILCNWLVCMAVWLATSADDTIGKIFACFFPITAFVASGFEHSIANMFFVPMGIMLRAVPELTAQASINLSNLTWWGFLFRNLIPVTIGNLIGGGFFVATLYWYAYLKPENPKKLLVSPLYKD
jgi:formate/nitrite transporter